MKGQQSRPIFILSCARSGSTSLCRILNEASNGRCELEPSPNLNRETRDMMEGRLKDAVLTLENSIIPRVRAEMEHVEVYGEKNVTYGPFIPFLHDMLNCKFVFIKRDGREVVRSLVNWHEAKFGTVYRECREPGGLTPEANAAAASLLVHRDSSDYSRPRPLKADPLSWKWETLTRAEMCAYYWSTINELYVDQLQRLPKDSWIEIDYSNVVAEDVERVAEFCGFRGLTRRRIQVLLDQKINSLEDRGASAGSYPDWKNWSSEQRGQFDSVAGPTMQRLGYYREKGSEWRPEQYGQWWKTQAGGPEWYGWMYEGRKKMHEDLLEWIHGREKEGERIQSIADLGCGLGVGYAEAFAMKRYVGFDLSERNVQWCQEHRRNELHAYRCLDFGVESLGESFDLVFSSGTLDNTYDIDRCLATMVHHSNQWVYVTFYRGWFEDLSAHRYHWSEEHTCFYNDASSQRIRKQLVQLGCRDIMIEPVHAGMGRREIPFETRVIARTSGRNGSP